MNSTPPDRSSRFSRKGQKQPKLLLCRKSKKRKATNLKAFWDKFREEKKLKQAEEHPRQTDFVEDKKVVMQQSTTFEISISHLPVHIDAESTRCSLQSPDDGISSTGSNTCTLQPSISTSPSTADEIIELMELERKTEETDLIMVTEPIANNVQCELNVEGRRVIDFQHFWNELKELCDHAPFSCTLKDIVIENENRIGLNSKFSVYCKMCGMRKTISTSANQPSQTHCINKSAVIGAMVSGGGFSHLDQILSSMDIPCMTAKTYSKYHNEACQNFENVALEEMKTAAEEEKKLAIQNGDVDTNGVPNICVVADGSWGKRSYRTVYNSSSGTAVIIGQKTKKVLYMGVRNKYCLFCVRYGPDKEHACFKNWDGSSSAMEASIIVEGFKRSEEMYGIRYSRIIADGDSSVYKKILDARPYEGLTVEKVECRNHLLRNYCSKMKDLVKTKSAGPLTQRQLLSQNIMRLRVGVKKAIQYRKQQFDVGGLRDDILNSPLHTFGEHMKCSSYFCNGPKTNEKNYVGDLKKCGLFDHIMRFAILLSKQSRSLIHDVDSNIAESCNAIIAKIIGGKRINYSLKGSYQGRSYLAAVSHNRKTPVYALHKHLFAASPGLYSKSSEMRRLKKAKDVMEHRKGQGSRKKLFQKNDLANYGELAEKPDLPNDEFEIQKEILLEKLKCNANNRKEIERETVLQGESQKWREIRRTMLTASNFGKIIRMRPTTSCGKMVKSLLYDNIVVAAMSYGTEKEEIARQQLESELQVTVGACGLFIDKQHPFFGASPDGLIGDDGIVEIKCPASAKSMTPDEAIESGKVRFWKKDKSGCFKINMQHHWYYQIQGQLHISQKEYCILACWTPLGLKCETIVKNDTFWNMEMKKKLIKFYEECLIPELIDPRHVRSMPIRNHLLA